MNRLDTKESRERRLIELAVTGLNIRPATVESAFVLASDFSMPDSVVGDTSKEEEDGC